MPMDRVMLGRRIREARERVGLTQSGLAIRAGFSAHQIVSQIEKGEREIKAVELVSLARELFVSVTDLLKPDASSVPPVLWREAPVERGAGEARFIQRFRRYAFVQRLTGFGSTLLPQRLTRPLSQLAFAEVELFAEAMRRQYELGSRPAHALVATAESQLGIQVWHDELQSGCSAACLVSEEGAAVLLNACEVPWRRNFSLAHELFHVLTWDAELIERMKQDAALFEHSEMLANVFAAALLMPAAPLRQELARVRQDGAIGVADLVAIASDFGVSAQALVWRLGNLGILARPKAKELIASPGLRIGVGKGDDLTRQKSLPDRFVRLAYLAWQEGRLSRSRLAEYLEVNVADLPDVLAVYGLNSSEPLPASVILPDDLSMGAEPSLEALPVEAL